MRSGTIAFLAGIVAIQQFATLPSLYWAAALPLVLVGLRRLRLRLPSAFALGMLWALVYAHWLLAHDWPDACQGMDLQADGTVLSIPAAGEGYSRFQFRIEHLQGCPQARLPMRARVGWYGPMPRLGAGERWQLSLRLKRRNGFFNPGGFDYEGWLLQQRIGATGYVREPDTALRLPSRFDPLAALHGWRQRVYDALQDRLPTRPGSALVLALALGERDRIQDWQWDDLRATGTSHLMAISGLHVGLAAGFGWVLGLWLWKRSALLCGWLPAQRAAVVPALLCAVSYAALAGFSIPTQRALLMLAVGMWALWSRRQAAAGRAWFSALLAVLLLDPLAVLSPGFWLSFGAVAVLLFGMGGRWNAGGLWWRWGRAQWLVGVGLLPLTLSAFQSVSLIGPLANLLAVPWVSLVVVPPVLLGTLLVGVFPTVSGWLLRLAAAALDLAWQPLQWLAQLPFATLAAAPALGWLPLAAVGVAWLLAPRGFPGRPAGALLLLPLWNAPPTPMAAGAVDFTLLDVGQGLAAVVRTQHHTLVYDTGPRFGPGFDAGRAVLVPFLRQAGIERIDRLVVSHDDRDHAGGYESLRRAVAVDSVLAGEPRPGQQRCQTGMRWTWDGVAFEVLHPSAGRAWKGNDASCVLRIEAPGGTVLLTGDVQRAGERGLASLGDALASDVLVAPHHGSATSSSPAFVGAVAPRWVLFATGYRNRFGFPRPAVRARYEAVRASTLSTADCGAIALRLRADIPPTPECSRRLQRRYWHRF